jgi:stage II sporulation protein P
MKRRSSRGPSAAAWFLLFISWTAIVPILLFVFRSAKAEIIESVPVSVQTDSMPETNSLLLTAAFDPIRDAGSLRGEQPTVLIYHTHTTEAYFKKTEDEYDSSSAWRTRDNAHNVTAVGEELKTILETQYGIHVIHDVTDHEPPKLSTAYDRSLETMLKYKAQYPSIVLFIDLHRDAYTETDKPCDFVTVNGQECARLMFVVGKGEKYEEKPFFTTNLTLAEKITEHLNAIEPSFARKIRIKTGRYNQHVAPNCLLVEVGHNANTLDQAKRSMQYLAECIVLSFRSDRISLSDWAPN